MAFPKSGRATQKEISKICNCSINTVSRALRDDINIADDTRERILQVAGELGYVRNFSARALRLGVSKMIAVIVNDIRNPYYANMIIDIDNHLTMHDYSMSILCTHTDEQLAKKTIKLAVSQSYDGILFSPLNNIEHILLLESSKIPFVMLDCWVDGVTADVAHIDDRRGGYLCARHLLDLGHRRIAYFAGPYVNSSQRERHAGIAQAFEETGVPFENLCMISWDKVRMNPKDGEMFQMLKPLHCTAIIAFNDVLAYHCMNDLKARGLRIPQDISLMGFDHIRRHNNYLPPLTSITAQEANTAQTAVEMLLRRIAQPDLPFEEKVLSVRIHDGGTTGRARA